MAQIGDRLRGFHILIAEDDYLFANILADLIRLYGGTVVGPVTSQKAATEICETTAPDCAVLDIRLADGPCYALADALIQRGIPVILASGLASSRIPDRFRALPTFVKPFDLARLAECLADCCRAGRGQ